MIDPEHVCTARPALTAERAVALLRDGTPGQGEYAAWLDRAETRVAIRLRLVRGGAR
jgi:hypothetical protein